MGRTKWAIYTSSQTNFQSVYPLFPDIFPLISKFASIFHGQLPIFSTKWLWQGWSWSTNWKKDGHHSELSAMLGDGDAGCGWHGKSGAAWHHSPIDQGLYGCRLVSNWHLVPGNFWDCPKIPWLNNSFPPVKWGFGLFGTISHPSHHPSPPIIQRPGGIKTVGFGLFDLLAFLALKASRQAYASTRLQVGMLDEVTDMWWWGAKP